LQIVLGGLGVMIVVVVAGLSTGLMDFFPHSDQGGIGVRAFAVTPWVGIIGAVQPWARILTIVLSALELPGVPLHTALGIYGLRVLLSNEGAALFSHPTPRTT
jgi:hypothetical protein